MTASNLSIVIILQITRTKTNNDLKILTRSRHYPAYKLIAEGIEIESILILYRNVIQIYLWRRRARVLLCSSAAICLGNCLNRPLKGLFMYNYFQIRRSVWCLSALFEVVRQKSHLLQQLSQEKIEISIEGSAIITSENWRFLRGAAVEWRLPGYLQTSRDACPLPNLQNTKD